MYVIYTLVHAELKIHVQICFVVHNPEHLETTGPEYTAYKPWMVFYPIKNKNSCLRISFPLVKSVDPGQRRKEGKACYYFWSHTSEGGRRHSNLFSL